MYIVYLQYILFALDSTILEESNMRFGLYIYHTGAYPIQKYLFCI